MYQISDYVLMMRDEVRMVPYLEALRQSVKNTSVVVDIGTGLGVFAMLAARLGARKVYAIEPNAAIQMARKLAELNGYSQRIEFIEGLSTMISLPEPADIIVSDLRGVLPLLGSHLTTIIDARERLLKPGGILIPQQDTLRAAVVEAPELYKYHHNDGETDYLGLALQPAFTFTTNTWRGGRVNEDQLLTAPCDWGQLNYDKLTSPNLTGELDWIVKRDGNAHGFVVWFDTQLTMDVGFSNAPGIGPKVYGCAFFPWSEPTFVTNHDHVCVLLNATLVDGDYVWTWETKVFDGDTDNLKSHFKQSTFFAQCLTSLHLSKRAAGFVPTPDADMEIDRFVLENVDARSNQGEIATRLQAQFPNRFKSWRDALTRVGDVAGRY